MGHQLAYSTGYSRKVNFREHRGISFLTTGRKGAIETKGSRWQEVSLGGGLPMGIGNMQTDRVFFLSSSLKPESHPNVTKPYRTTRGKGCDWSLSDKGHCWRLNFLEQTALLSAVRRPGLLIRNLKGRLGAVTHACNITSALWEPKASDCLSPGVQDQPGQHSKTLSLQN